MPKVTFLKSRGHLGKIIRAGATIEVSDFWAEAYTADGTAFPAEETQPAEKPESEPKKKKGKK